MLDKKEMDSVAFVRKSIDTISAAQKRVKDKYADRMRRTYLILQSFNSELANQVFNQHPKQDPQNQAAILIQKTYKGYKARQLYKDLLYELYEEELEKSRSIELKRMEEGLLELENIQLEEQIKEKQFLARQKEIERNWAATVIQRRFRDFKGWRVPMEVLPQIQEKKALYKTPQQQPRISVALKERNFKDFEGSDTLEPDWNMLGTFREVKHELSENSEPEDEDEDDVFMKPHNVSLEETISENEVPSEMSQEFQTGVLEFSGIVKKDDFSMTLYQEKNPTGLSPQLNKKRMHMYSPSIAEDLELPLLINNCEEGAKYSLETLRRRAIDLQEAIKSKT